TPERGQGKRAPATAVVSIIDDDDACPGRSSDRPRLNKQIAIDLGITEKTVKVTHNRCVKKLGCGRGGTGCLVDAPRVAAAGGSLTVRDPTTRSQRCHIVGRQLHTARCRRRGRPPPS